MFKCHNFYGYGKRCRNPNGSLPFSAIFNIADIALQAGCTAVMDEHTKAEIRPPLQFSISVMLIIGTIVIVKQMSYVQNKALGYDKEHTIVLPIDNNDINNKKHTFKNELQNNSDIAAVSTMSGEPGGFFDDHMFDVEGQREKFKSRTEFADFEFVKTLGLKIIAGRDFSAQYPTDTMGAVLINRTAAAKLGFTPEQAIGKWIQNTVPDNARRRVIGVVEDFNFLSLKENMDALVISPAEDRRVVVIKLKPGSLQSEIGIVQDEFKKVAPAYPFDYTFLDKSLTKCIRPI